VATPQQGEVWLVDLGLAAKVRPALSSACPLVTRTGRLSRWYGLLTLTAAAVMYPLLAWSSDSLRGVVGLAMPLAASAVVVVLRACW
jgi:hypothetical protein